MKATLTLSKAPYCWLFGGFGFHNAEATMTGIMPDRLKNEYVLKSFREISPTFSRVFAGYADWSREAMDSFADYYDLTFRRAGTTLYMVPGRMPYRNASFDTCAYAEETARRLDYLINGRNCRKIRYYCVSNELSRGNTYAYFRDHMEEFKNLHEALYDAFLRHHLDVGLLAPDCSGSGTLSLIDWTIKNMDEVTEAYCWHNYELPVPAGDKKLYQTLLDLYRIPVQAARRKEKRFILGEFGVPDPKAWQSDVMRNDICSGYTDEAEAAAAAVALAEEEMAILNAGCQAAALWTFMDYPDPFFREDGDTAEEHARYECARFSGHGISIRYNKWGLFRWDEDARDYRARPAMYTAGPIARYFRKNSRVLTCETDCEALRCGAVTNADGSVSLCIINHSDHDAEVDIIQNSPAQEKAYRCLEYDMRHVPADPFNDLQPFTVLKENTVTVPSMGMALLTTDYTDRVPSAIGNVRMENGSLAWDPCTDPEHCYYRVFREGRQIASTVAEHLERDDFPGGRYTVISVDKWGNAGT